MENINLRSVNTSMSLNDRKPITFIFNHTKGLGLEHADHGHLQRELTDYWNENVRRTVNALHKTEFGYKIRDILNAKSLMERPGMLEDPEHLNSNDNYYLDSSDK